MSLRLQQIFLDCFLTEPGFFGQIQNLWSGKVVIYYFCNVTKFEILVYHASNTLKLL